MLYLGRWLGDSGRDAIVKYDLKKRRYLGLTSMDAELSLVTANLAHARPGAMFYDPFVGTGSFAVTAAHFGATVIGSDIDGRTIRGSRTQNHLSNYEQYHLLPCFLDNFIADLTHAPLRALPWLNGIICDPPYGVREGPRVLGYREKDKDTTPILIDGVEAHMRPGYIPPKKPYGFDDMLEDVLEFAVIMLVPNGRLAIWMPTANEDDVEWAIPTNPGLRLLSACVQQFNKWSRRLLTYTRIPSKSVEECVPEKSRVRAQGNANDLNQFRRRRIDQMDNSSNHGRIIEFHGDPSLDEPLHEEECYEEAQNTEQDSDSESLLADILHGALAGQETSAKRLLSAFGINPPEFFCDRPDSGYYQLLGAALLQELSTRHKLPQYNTIEDAVELIRTRQNIMVITGAGISTNLGVPDFRSKNTGFYDQMREKGFDSPEDIFDLHTFREDPSIFYSNSSATLPEPSKSTPTHAFIKLLDSKGKLLTNYTQNIDNVEGNVGLSKDKLIQCHGSWASFTCQTCGYKTDGQKYYQQIKAKSVVYCDACRPPSRPSKRKRSSHSTSRPRQGSPDTSDDDYGPTTIGTFEPGVMKPDITFFHEKLPDTFFDRFKKRDKDIVDLILVIGTSMSVSPVSEIPMAVSPDVPQIIISREKVRHVNFDVTLLGDCDLITEELAKRLSWAFEHPMLKRREVELVELDHAAAIWEINEQGQDAVHSITHKEKEDLGQKESPEPEKTTV
ncbi:MAG: hypothetical protein Q9162_004756 [Coniocarpon cinnabarinum]